MLAHTPTLPPALQRIAATPVLISEMPAGFAHFKITRLAADPRIQSRGVVRIDFTNSHGSESASYALLRTHAAAVGLIRRASAVRTGGLFYVRATAVGSFAVVVTATTDTEAKTFLTLALSHLRRSER